MRLNYLLLAISSIILVGLCSVEAADPISDPPPTIVSGKRVTRLGDAWPLEHCPVSGEKLSELSSPHEFLYQRREIRLCCSDCATLFNASPDEFLKKADAQIIAEQKDDFPLNYCVVMPHMNLAGREDVDFYDVIGNRFVINCCEDCRKELTTNPDKYLADLDRAIIEKQLEAYPLDNCIVGGEKLGSMGEPINYVHANQMVRFCCAGCIDAFEANPTKYMKELKAQKKSPVTADTGE